MNAVDSETVFFKHNTQSTKFSKQLCIGLYWKTMKNSILISLVLLIISGIEPNPGPVKTRRLHAQADIGMTVLINQYRNINRMT